MLKYLNHIFNKKVLLKIAKRIRHFFISPLIEKYYPAHSAPENNSVNQKYLMMIYKQLFRINCEPIMFSDCGFRVYSQHEEDGLLLFVFSIIGTTNKKSVEICAGDGMECNTANLIINHRWISLLVDGNNQNIEKAKSFYANHPDTKYWPPKIIKKWVTKHNVNQIIQENGFSGEIDLLSLDIDGNDFWIWKEISTISPRVVVLEFNHLWGPEKSLSTPYSDEFVAEFTEFGSDYAGASLSAFVNLGKIKGYRLVGTNAIATNAFFIRNDILNEWLPEIGPNCCFGHPRAQFGITRRLPAVRHKEWVEV